MINLGHVVQRTPLHDRTARYVLSRSERLGIPPAPGSGNHRVFSPESAMRVSICGLLVTYGVQIELAIDATLWCERRVMAMTRAERDRYPLYGSGSLDPWLLEIIHGEFIQVWRRKDHENFDDDEYFSLVQRKKVKLPDMPTVRHWAKIDLTAVEAMILGA